MEKELFNFENLQVYRKALDYLDFVYELLKKFPNEERYNLTDQFRRAATSISLNLAEGWVEQIKNSENLSEFLKDH